MVSAIGAKACNMVMVCWGGHGRPAGPTYSTSAGSPWMRSARLVAMMGAGLANESRQRIGIAYISPPRVHKSLAPRSSLSGDLSPTLRSKIWP